MGEVSSPYAIQRKILALNAGANQAVLAAKAGTEYHVLGVEFSLGSGVSPHEVVGADFSQTNGSSDVVAAVAGKEIHVMGFAGHNKEGTADVILRAKTTTTKRILVDGTALGADGRFEYAPGVTPWLIVPAGEALEINKAGLSNTVVGNVACLMVPTVPAVEFHAGTTTALKLPINRAAGVIPIAHELLPWLIVPAGEALQVDVVGPTRFDCAVIVKEVPEGSAA